MLAQPSEDVAVTQPLLQHLRGQLNEVSLHIVGREPRKLSVAADVVHDVAELMENGAHFVAEKYRLFGA